jgi:hypothetical protein
VAQMAQDRSARVRVRVRVLLPSHGVGPSRSVARRSSAVSGQWSVSLWRSGLPTRWCAFWDS